MHLLGRDSIQLLFSGNRFFDAVPDLNNRFHLIVSIGQIADNFLLPGFRITPLLSPVPCHRMG
ncbi:hypothetical protein D3C73_1630300 [compost metagenome]